MDKKVISCAFNIDTACVEVRFVDGSMIAIDCTLVEAEVARNMCESSELEWLVYHAPVEYVNLLLHLSNAYESFREMEITGGDRDLAEKEEALLAEERDALTALCKKEAAKCSS